MSDTNDQGEVLDPDEAREQLSGLIKDIRFAMLTTRHIDGDMHARPMTTQGDGIDSSSSLWFFMSRDSEPVADLRAMPSVCLSYADPGKDAYVSVSGSAAVVDDMAQKRRLWSKLNDAWFPQGPEDPDCALVQVRVMQGEFWDVKQNKLTQLYKIGKAAITKTPPTNMGQHGHVNL